MDICVVALGKIGLPLAVQFASKGHRVIGADVSAGDKAVVHESSAPIHFVALRWLEPRRRNLEIPDDPRVGAGRPLGPIVLRQCGFVPRDLHPIRVRGAGRRRDAASCSPSGLG